MHKSIIEALNKFLPEFRGVVLDLGCGDMPYKKAIMSNEKVTQYIAIDWPGTKYYHNVPDLIWDGHSIPLEDNSVDVVLFTEVAEHIDDPAQIFNEIYRVLRKGGFVVGTTPFFWMIHEVPNDMRRMTPFSLKKLFEEIGYESHDIKGSGGWNRSMAQMLGMYVEIGLWGKKYLKKIAKAITYFPILYLTKHDVEVSDFRHTGMINSISFKAIK
jgi:SAM-dependent methyltransferase